MFIPFGTIERTVKRRWPLVTTLLVVANVAVFIYQIYLALTFGDVALSGFIDDYAVVPAEVTDGSPLEVGLLTSMFLHAGILHIASNMLFLMPFGDNVEDRLGHVRYLLFYILCGLAASFIHIIFGPNSVVPALGASGAIAGVLAAYLVLHPGGVVRGLFFFGFFFTSIELPAWVFIGFWFVAQLFNGLASLDVATNETGGVAFWAHVGGFVAGLVLAPILRLRQHQVRPDALG